MGRHGQAWVCGWWRPVHVGARGGVWRVSGGPDGCLAQGRGVPLLLCAPHIHSPTPAPWPAARSNFTNHNKLKREAMKVIASCIDADGSGEGRRWLAEVGAEGGSQAAHGVR